MPRRASAGTSTHTQHYAAGACDECAGNANGSWIERDAQGAEYRRGDSRTKLDATISDHNDGVWRSLVARLTGGQEVSRVQIPAPRPNRLRRSRVLGTALKQTQELLRELVELLTIFTLGGTKTVVVDHADLLLHPFAPAHGAHATLDL